MWSPDPPTACISRRSRPCWRPLSTCASLERPALIRRPDGGWRLYVSCSTLGSKHWWVEAIDTPPGGEPADLENGKRTVVLPGDEVSAWKDVVVTRDGPSWRMWACEHLLDQGEDEADRMRSVYLTSTTGSTGTTNGSRSGRPTLLGSPRRPDHQRLGTRRQMDRQL